MPTTKINELRKSDSRPLCLNGGSGGERVVNGVKGEDCLDTVLKDLFVAKKEFVRLTTWSTIFVVFDLWFIIQLLREIKDKDT